MLPELLIKYFKYFLKFTLVYMSALVFYGTLIYECVNILSKILNWCFTYILYFMSVIVNNFLKEIIYQKKNLCFDLLKLVYEQNPDVKSYSDIVDLLKEKVEPRFDSCISGLSTVLSRHCSRLSSVTPNSIETLNQLGVSSVGGCVDKVSYVMSNYCNSTYPNYKLTEKSIFFENCEKELFSAVRNECDILLKTYGRKPIELGYLFNSFESLCFEQKKTLGVELCLDGLNRVIPDICVWEKVQFAVISNLSTLQHLFIENILFISFLVIILFFVYLALHFIFNKLFLYFVYGNDLLKKYPQDNNETIIINYRSSNQYHRDLINKLKNGNPPEFNVLGLDCEISSDTTNHGRPCPAVLQLARPDGYCVIFQLKHMEDFSTIIDILNNNKTLFVGVGILNDINNLRNMWGLTSNRCLDVRHLAANLNYKHPLSLQALASKVLNVNCKKNPKLGPWENFNLTEKQIKYAAQDARFSVQIFMKLNNEKICQNFGGLKRLFWNENLYWKKTLTLWEKFVGKHFVLQPVVANKASLEDCLLLDNYTPESYVPESLCLHRYCSVCGLTDEVTLKAILPLDYRIKFSSQLPHYLDLCKSCIIKNQKEDFIFRNFLADICGVSYPVYKTEQLQLLKLLCKGILNSKSMLDDPVSFLSINSMLKRLSVQLGISCDRLTTTLRNVEVLSNMDCWPKTVHADEVCQYFSNDGEKIRRIWCDHFIQTMKPAFLPESWERFYSTETLLKEPYII